MTSMQATAYFRSVTASRSFTHRENSERSPPKLNTPGVEDARMT
jgi:hypothetical protein